MSGWGGHPMQSMTLNNHTIAASAGGTASSTIVGTISAAYARSFSVFNLTLRNIELTFGKEAGTSAIPVFCPGNTTANGAMAGMSMRNPIAVTEGIVVRARTTENTAITCASTTPLVLNFWA